MICYHLSGYTLRQIPGQNVTYVTTPEGDTKRAISGELTPEAIKPIILSLGKSLG